ncbi:MAG: alanine--glyoxylate aminotransferase [Pelagibacteraceae bacterium TMED237]|nr:alanine--glyoxylate aminotransferase [Candidatus Neomarinimicrobiota bacterium]OUW96758.1 MAG: alanine--glyoxylate aminotransferase [Pelagibacteraceae bacterium TMED237]
MGPGPSTVSPNVYRALSTYTVGHLDRRFLDIMDDVKQMIRDLFKTNNKLTLPVSGTGTAAMESCFVNMIEKNDKILIPENGYFGKRMIDMCSRLGADVDVLSFEWGKPLDIDILKKKLEKNSYKFLAMVHAETSTGVRNPVEEISSFLNKDTIFIVDAVTSLGTIELNVDLWGIDAIYSCSQKGLSCPPGASPVSFSEKAMNKILNRKTKVPNFYLDMQQIIQYLEGEQRTYHHTAPINSMYAIYQGLLDIHNEGLDNIISRHAEAHNLLVQELNEIGVEMLVSKEFRLPSLNSVIIPKGLDDFQIRSKLINNYNIEIGAGLGPLSGKIWRIGLMGYSANKNNVNILINALKDIIS